MISTKGQNKAGAETEICWEGYRNGKYGGRLKVMSLSDNRQGAEWGDRASCVDNRGENIPGGGNSTDRPAEGLCVTRSRNRKSPTWLPQSERRGRNGTQPRRKVTECQAGSAGPGEGPGFFLKGLETASSKM